MKFLFTLSLGILLGLYFSESKNIQTVKRETRSLVSKIDQVLR